MAKATLTLDMDFRPESLDGKPLGYPGKEGEEASLGQLIIVALDNAEMRKRDALGQVVGEAKMGDFRKRNELIVKVKAGGHVVLEDAENKLLEKCCGVVYSGGFLSAVARALDAAEVHVVYEAESKPDSEAAQ